MVSLLKEHDVLGHVTEISPRPPISSCVREMADRIINLGFWNLSMKVKVDSNLALSG